jgi:hypothetical protein
MRASAAAAGVVVLSLAGTGVVAGREGRQAPSDAPAAAAAITSERPRLVVFLSVDQFRRDYIERYGRGGRAGGPPAQGRRRFDQAAYPTFTPSRAPGTTMSTGVYPATRGRTPRWDRASGRATTCTDDGGAKAIGHRAGPKAPSGGTAPTCCGRRPCRRAARSS